MIVNLATGLEGAQRIETHISSLLLIEGLVYKFKKPLDLGFLDFSTLEKRREACEDEVRLNRRTAPGLYLGVVEIRGTLEAPEIGGVGPILDYAVEMRRFDEANRLDHMLKQQRLTIKQVDELADCIAEFHGRLKGADRPKIESFESDATRPVIAPMRANFLELLSREQVPGPRGKLVRLAAWTERRFEELREFLSERYAQGFVRECHGDLHLGNITLVDERITLFDCIEFSAELRWTDLLCDLAFLIMDFEDRGAPEFSHRVLDRYLQVTGDFAGLRLMRFYQMYRAMVRAKICAIRLGQQDCDRESSSQEYAGYMALAERYLEPVRPRLILMHGVSASGKSWVSQSLLEKLGAIRLRSDRERKRLFPNEAELYDAAKTQATYARLLELSAGILRAGYPAIVDATFLNPIQRMPFAQLAQSMGIPMSIVHTQADLATLQERLASRAKEKSNISDATLSVLLDQLESLEPLDASEPVVAWDTTASMPIEELIARLH